MVNNRVDKIRNNNNKKTKRKEHDSKGMSFFTCL